MRRIISIALIVALFYCLAGCAPAVGVSTGDEPCYAAPEPSQPGSGIVPTVTVTGEGKLTLTPDQATITLGVESRGKDVSEASDENAAAMAAIREAMKAFGVEEADMKTTNYSIYEDYIYRDGESRPNGFVVNNSLQVKLNDLSRVGEAVDAAVAAGANSSYGIRFGVEDPSARKAELAALAAEDARKQAEAYAEACGRTLGEAVSITSGSGSTNVIMETPAAEMADAAPAANGMSRSTGTSFSAGTMELTERVTICYRME